MHNHFAILECTGPACRPGGRQAGFTMLEMLVTIAIVAILAAVGIPSYQKFVISQNLQAEVNNLYNDVIFARSEAIKEGQYVSICPANATLTGCSTSSSWSTGWIIYSNPGTNAATTYTSGTDIILRTQPAFTSSDTLSTSPASTILTFNRDGFGMNLSATTGLLFEFHDANNNTAATRCLWLNLMGVPVIQSYGATAATDQGTNTCQ